MRTLTVLLVLCLAFLGLSQAKKSTCTLDMQAGDDCKSFAMDLLPTQASVGMVEVQERVAKINAMTSSELNDYLFNHVVPVVIGQGGFYITDHHHLLLALHLSQYSDHFVFVQVLCNWSDMTYNEFWSAMVFNKWTYLRDNQDNPITPAQLPRSVAELQDDPYRTLAWMVVGVGYNKTCTPFSEFRWAEYFSDSISLSPGDSYDTIHDTVPLAVTLARSPAAKGLPGWVPPDQKVSKKSPVCPVRADCNAR